MEGEEALRLNEQLESDSDAAVPKDVQYHCMETIRKTFFKQRLRSASNITKVVIQRISLVATIGMLMFTVVFAVSEDFRILTLNTVVQVFDDHTRITFQTTTGAETLNSDNSNLSYQYNIALEWLPEKYKFEYGKSDAAGDLLSFTSLTDGSLVIEVSPYGPNTVYSLNTEDCTKKQITIQGYSATLYTVNDTMIHRRYAENGMENIWSERSVIWVDELNQIIIHITANNMSEDEFLNLAEGFHWSK